MLKLAHYSVLNRCAEVNFDAYPKAEQTIMACFYMDDKPPVLDTRENVKVSVCQVKSCLRGWGSRFCQLSRKLLKLLM